MKAEIVPEFEVIIDDTIPPNEMHLCIGEEVLVKFSNVRLSELSQITDEEFEQTLIDVAHIAEQLVTKSAAREQAGQDRKAETEGEL